MIRMLGGAIGGGHLGSRLSNAVFKNLVPKQHQWIPQLGSTIAGAMTGGTLGRDIGSGAGRALGALGDYGREASTEGNIFIEPEVKNANAMNPSLYSPAAGAPSTETPSYPNGAAGAPMAGPGMVPDQGSVMEGGGAGEGSLGK